MRLNEIFSMAVDGIKERRFRAALNIVGILIGITAVTALVSITQGMSASINQQLEFLSPTTIAVVSGGFGLGGQGGGGGSLTLRDVDRVKSISDVAAVTPIVSGTAEVVVGGVSDFAAVVGIAPEEYTRAIRSIKVAEGRFLRRSDSASAVLGANIAHPSNLEEPIAHVGSRVTIIVNVMGEEKRLTLRVAGILAEVGGGAMFSSPDDQVLVTVRTAQQIFNTGNVVNQILIEAESIEAVDDIAEEIQNEFGEGFMVITTGFIREAVGNITIILGAVLGGIAAISLVVAGIGVINTMTISVMERTREIGIMKALGAKNRNILLMFLTEAFLMGLFGGVVGAILGVLLSYVVSAMATYFLAITFPLTPAPSLEIGLAGIVFAVVVGTLSGLYPARKASKLNPVEALRYE